MLGALVVCNCDGGLEPSSESGPVAPSGFSGVVTFSNWEAADSLYDLRLVAFSVYPPGEDIVTEVLQGRALVYPPLGNSNTLAERGADSVSYTIGVSPGTYPYVVVAQQFGPDVFQDWRAVGQYDLDTNLTLPSPVVVTEGVITQDIDIAVDFANLPPFP